MEPSLPREQHWTIARLTFWYLDRGRSREAETLARGLLAVDQRDGLAWLYYAEARRQQDDIAEAARALGEASKLLDDRPDVWMRLGDTLLRLRRPGEARRALEKGRQMARDDEVLLRRINALLVACTKR